MRKHRGRDCKHSAGGSSTPGSKEGQRGCRARRLEAATAPRCFGLTLAGTQDTLSPWGYRRHCAPLLRAPGRAQGAATAAGGSLAGGPGGRCSAAAATHGAGTTGQQALGVTHNCPQKKMHCKSAAYLTLTMAGSANAVCKLI